MQSEQPPGQHDPLWYIKTRQWFCQQFLRSHPVSRKDLPSSFINHSTCKWKRPFLWEDQDRKVATSYHKFQEHHKQIIIRYVTHFDILDSRARRYLRDLLAPGDFLIRSGDTMLSLQVEPRVIKVEDEIRLLIRHRWNYTPVSRPVTIADIDCIDLCPHVGTQQGQMNPGGDPIMSRLREALCDLDGDRQMDGSCRECCLEYTVGQYPGDKLNQVFIAT